MEIDGTIPRFVEATGIKGYHIYYTDKGVAYLPEIPEPYSPQDRVYWKLDENNPLVKKAAKVIKKLPSLVIAIAMAYNVTKIDEKILSKALLSYTVLKALNFKATSIFIGYDSELKIKRKNKKHQKYS